MRAGSALVVMVEAVEDWTRDDAAAEVRLPRDRLLLGDPLMRPGLVVEDDELGEEAAQVRHVEEEDVVEQLAAESANEPLGEGVHVGRAYGGADDAGVCPSKAAANHAGGYQSRAGVGTMNCGWRK